MKTSLISSAIILALSLTACQKEQSTSSTTQTDVAPTLTREEQGASKGASLEVNGLNEQYQQATKSLFKARALSATMYGLSPEKAGVYYQNQLENYSPESEANLRKALSELSKSIKAAKIEGANSLDITNQQVMAGITQYFAGHEDFPMGYIDTWMGLSPFIVNQINGPLIDIPRIMQNDQPITNLKEAQDYLERLSKFGELVTSIEEKLAFDTAKNWLPPVTTISGAVRYLKGFTSLPANEHGFVTNFEDKLNKIDNISEKEKQQLISSAVKNVSEVVYPAYNSIQKAAEKLVPLARKEAGIWAQPNGEKYYKEAIFQLGDSLLSADDIHQIGLDEVARISKEMDTILKAQGYDKGSVGKRMVSLNEEARFLYEDSKAGREELLNDINGYIAEINEKMKPFFKTKPNYEVEVKAFPVEIQDGAPGGQYSSPALDGSKPGIYWINLRDMKANPKFGLKTLTYHEANPGHHWQVALNMEQASLPFLRRIAPYNAYVEGWALYSEQVAKELGMYENDPFGDLGRLQAELFRAVRLVVDTGMHHKRWTREEAIQYMGDITGTAESDVIAEIERYITWPGQALGYKLGMIKILSLREEAKAILGDKFDLSAFHDKVLLSGAVPMAVLDTNIKAWVESQK
ncbi:MAG: DUF885 domain-containing protein [Colwellia sp.]